MCCLIYFTVITKVSKEKKSPKDAFKPFLIEKGNNIYKGKELFNFRKKKTKKIRKNCDVFRLGQVRVIRATQGKKPTKQEPTGSQDESCLNVKDCFKI